MDNREEGYYEHPLIVLGIAGVVVLCIIGVMARGPEHSENPSQDRYTIDGHSCECTIICYGGSDTKLLCTDSTGHMFETTVRNHRVKLIE